MIVEKLIEIFFDLLIGFVDLFSIPLAPDFIVNTMDEFYAFTLKGIRFAQYFFDEGIYNTFIALYMTLYVLRPTSQLVMWAYNKIRGC